MRERLPNWIFDPQTPEEVVEEYLKSRGQKSTTGLLPNRRWPNWMYDPRTPDETVKELLDKAEQ